MKSNPANEGCACMCLFISYFLGSLPSLNRLRECLDWNWTNLIFKFYFGLKQDKVASDKRGFEKEIIF